MRKSFSIIAMALCFILLLTVNAAALETKVETLTIKGDGVNKAVTFTREDIMKMSSEIKKEIYSVTNNFPTDKVMYKQGVPLAYLLKQAGIKDTAKQLKCTSSDGYSRNFTRQELLNDERYYFAVDGTKKKVVPIIAFTESGKGFERMSDTELVLTMGQRVAQEQNNPWFVKYLKVIEVSNVEPTQWSPVTFTAKEDGDKLIVTLGHNDFDAVKIYYTTDGTNPTLSNAMYNPSATHFQPELNKPIVVAKDTEVKAIAIGAGKINSIVASNKKATSNSGGRFTDLDNFAWAKGAIEELTGKGIIKGMGDSRFAPGESLTRAQFATIMVLALGETPVTKGQASFKDVKNSDWYHGYVEKAAAMGIIKGYPDNTFDPEKALSRQEMLTVIVQAIGTMPENGASEELLLPFGYENRISDWAKGYVAYAEYLGILEHGHIVTVSNGRLYIDAQNPANRAEAAMTVYLMLNS